MSKGETKSKSEILNILRYLEQCGSPKETAERYGVSRQVIYKWRKKFNLEYKAKKTDIEDYSLTVEAKKMLQKDGTAKLTAKTLTLYEEIIDHFINDFENFEKLSGKDKVSLMNTIMPYVLEKKGVIPPQVPKTPGEGNTQNNFFLEIIEKQKNGNSEDEIRRNIEAITVPHDS